MQIVKESKNLGVLVFKEISKNESKKIIIKNHYSHTWNNGFGTVNIGVFKNDELLGCAVFGNLMNPKSYSKIAEINKDNILELNRLWISDELGHNAESMLLGACWRILKKCHPQVKIIQSFADGRLGVGTIYKATNFKYYGKKTTKFYRNKNTGEIRHRAIYTNILRLNTILKHADDMVSDNLELLEVNSYRYLYLLDKSVSIKLKEKPYPEYQKGVTVKKAIWSNGVLANLYVMLNHTGNFELAEKALSLITEDKELFLKKANENKHIQKFKLTTPVVVFKEEK